MNFFRFIFGSKKQEEPLKEEEPLKQDITISDFRKKQEAYQLKKSIENIEVSLYVSYSILHELNDEVYFTYQNKFNDLRKEVETLSKANINSKIWVKANKMAKKRFMSDFDIDKLDDVMIDLNSNPSLFLDNLNAFHKEKLIKSIDEFYKYWLRAVKALKQKAAKTKRKLYVINGYKELKKELITLKALDFELELIDKKIEQISNEDWSSL
ncbi:hypothetical protein FHR24_001481 [Wenyingzhuangia heitensis]|uniref:Uncharacterized protein n=1 Tax=Wenyingzhuangia heitensis TaxID=1487859 RepID=A0ABX0U899_9FLAO|nr:hypothetical protein [Wenyingzhuangia heitensis]NIJ45042.1 hypothetical protein [Wenyingzhuangia heitensis]